MHELPQIHCPRGVCCKRGDGMKLVVGSRCDIGNHRDSNDDLAFASDHCRSFVVLDGMGGYAGGAEASRIVLEKLQRKIKSMCFRGDDETDANLEDTVARAIRVAALDMVRAASTNSSFRKMGTVFSLAYIVNGTLLWTHVGDSRIYLYRENQLHQLTKDETYVQKMVDSHQLSADEVRHHPMRNIVTNAISTRFQHALPVVRSLKLQDNDVVVLTTDGITDMLLPVEIKNLLNLRDEPQAAADAIARSAIEEGSRDNCTCVVVRVDQLGTIES